MASFYIPLIKTYLPILKECYGFDISEISSELSHILLLHSVAEKINDDLINKCRDEKGRIDSEAYAIQTEDYLEIPTAQNHEEQLSLIENLCTQTIEAPDKRDEAIFILTFMSAIFSRDINGLYADASAQDVQEDYWYFDSFVRPDLLRLYIALHKSKHKLDTPIKICFKTDSPHVIRNRWGWFYHMLNDYITQKPDDLTIEDAEKELTLYYSEERGRKSNNPYLNYIINGTYNFVRKIFPSEKVTVKQCDFLLQYLKAVKQVKESDKLCKLNNLQSHIRELLKSQNTPVQKHAQIRK